jgi:Mg-chelatase subunit ChlD
MSTAQSRCSSARLPCRTGHQAALLACALCLAVVGLGCGNPSVSSVKPAPSQSVARSPAGVAYIDLPKVEPRTGTAVVILVDTSGSMAQAVPDGSGKMRPKNQIAREALERIIQNTADWKKGHADKPLQLAIYHFASSAAVVLPMSQFDADKAQAALKRIPAPNGGTAIGKALHDAFKALYGSGYTRKFVLCITDGENTVGPPPDVVARQLHAQTGGGVELHFVAFDTSARQFKFLNNVNGHVVEAADGGQLQAELARIYEKRILAEKPDEQQK